MSNLPCVVDIGQDFGISYHPEKVKIIEVIIKYKHEDCYQEFVGTHEWKAKAEVSK